MSDRTTREELRALREKTIETLSDQFANDNLDVDEFEQRVDDAHRADSKAKLDALLADLVSAKSANSDALVPATPSIPALAREAGTGNRGDRKWLVSVFGGIERKGAWRVPRQLRAVAIMGGQELDLREVILPPGETTVTVFALMGGINIIVPPTMAVECEGTAIMGGFEYKERSSRDSDPDEPRLHIKGMAVMGGVEIHTRLPGESKRQARKRRKKELKATDTKRLEAGKKQLPAGE